MSLLALFCEKKVSVLLTEFLSPQGFLSWFFLEAFGQALGEGKEKWTYSFT